MAAVSRLFQKRYKVNIFNIYDNQVQALTPQPSGIRAGHYRVICGKLGDYR